MTTTQTTSSYESQFTVTAITHEGCEHCQMLIQSAITLALGSTGATVTDDRTRVGGDIHTVTVERTSCRWAGTDCCCNLCSAARKAVQS